MLVPPINFALVHDGVYRSGHPIDINYSFLETLGLKTIIYLGDRTAEDNAEYAEWAAAHDIRYLAVTTHSVKEPFQMNEEKPMRICLELLNDSSNFPILVHSNKGKHRVGVLCGILRKQNNWALSGIYEEYLRFARSKADIDMQFIEQFEL